MDLVQQYIKKTIIAYEAQDYTAALIFANKITRLLREMKKIRKEAPPET